MGHGVGRLQRPAPLSFAELGVNHVRMFRIHPHRFGRCGFFRFGFRVEPESVEEKPRDQLEADSLENYNGRRSLSHCQAPPNFPHSSPRCLDIWGPAAKGTF